MRIQLSLALFMVFSPSIILAGNTCDEARAVWADVKDSGSEAALQSYADTFFQCGVYHELAQEALLGVKRSQASAEEIIAQLPSEDETVETATNFSAEEIGCLHSAASPNQLSDFPGISWTDIETDYALEVCGAANSSFSEVQAAYARVLLKDRQYGPAFDLALKAADGGSGSGMNTMGAGYYRGRALPQSFEKAFYWYSKAAKTGFPMGQYNVATMYQKGEHVETDIHKAIEFYTQAAEGGYATAQDKLGDMHRRGEGVPKDLDLALGWYQRAIETSDHTDSMFYSGRIHAGLEGDDYPVDDIMALELYELGALLGNKHAQHSAAQVYFHGYGVEKNHPLAALYFQDAAEQGHVKSMRKHGRITHESGDVEGAIFWYTKAAKAGDEVAQQLLDEILN